MTTAETVMKNYENGLLGTGLVRAMLSAEAWLTPMHDGLPLQLLSHSGERWLNLFSNDGAMMAFCAAHGIDTTLFMSLPGASVFDGIAPTLAGINIDADTPTGFHYRRNQFAMLQSVVDARKIEGFLHGTLELDAPFIIMRNYADYLVLVRPDGGWMLAPDSQGRRLLAICMTDDTAEALQAQVLAELKVATTLRRLDGRTLFAGIQQQSTLQGLVFNPAGVVKPRAMTPALAGIVLSA